MEPIWPALRKPKWVFSLAAVDKKRSYSGRERERGETKEKIVLMEITKEEEGSFEREI